MRDSVIQLNELRCSYGNFEAVRGVSLKVGEGELFALLGTNGAGKTTTMETVEGHRAPTSGTVRVLGMDPFRDRAAVRRNVGIMLQEGGFAGDLTVAETVRMWQSMTSRPSEVDTIMATLDLTHRLNVRVKQLSGGQRRKLDLVLATLGRPKVLFLDEPTTGLDPESRAATWDLIRSLVEDGTSVLLTTHYLEEAQALAQRLAIMHEGRIAVAGDIAVVVAREPARIHFELPRPPADLADLAIRGTFDDTAAAPNQVRIRTEDLPADLWEVLRWAREHDVELRHLSANHASLDDIFRAITTKSDLLPTGSTPQGAHQ